MTDTFTNDPEQVTAEKPINYFDRYDADSQAGDPGLLERARLNAAHSFYRGTLAGASDLANMNHIVHLDDKDISPEQKKWREGVRGKYADVVADLGRYDLIRPWGTTTEGALALAGQIGGGIASPESLLGWGAKGASLAIRTAKAALQQGAITAAADPIVQGLNIAGGVQQKYEPLQTVTSFGVGAIIGGGLHIGGELISSGFIKKTVADLGRDDPQFRSPQSVAETISNEAAPESRTPAEVNGEPGTAVKEAASEPIAGFTTAKGSTYTVNPDGTTIRDKAARPDAGHEGDSGIKPSSEKTYFADPEAAGALAIPQDVKWRVIDNGDGTISLATLNQDGKWGISPEARNVPVSTAPEQGKIPVELWKAEEVYGKPAFGEVHFGNEITEVRRVAPVKEVAAIPADTPTPRTPEQQALIARRDAITSGDELALAKRTGGGGTLPMERQRPAEGKTTDPDGLTGTAVANVAQVSPQQDVAIKSLQQQAMSLAEALDIPLRQGRIKNKNALGTFNTNSGVVRVREVPDFEVVAHEAGHAIEAKVGQALTDLTNKFSTELAPLVSNPAAYDPKIHVKEGFAEFIRRYIGNPAHAEQIAPGFTTAFRDFMGRTQPDMLKAIDEAGSLYRAYLEAPSVDAVGAVVRSRSEEAHGWRKVVEKIREDGFPATVKSVVQSVYTGLFDDKAPVARGVRDLAKAIRDKQEGLVDLKAADNPEALLRLFERSHQSAVRDMMDGVRGYHSIDPEGPSLSSALEIATGGVNSGGWGKWDPDKKALFSDYMVARRAALLWDKFSRGDLANSPVAFSKADATIAMTELEKANPRFREASDQVHQWTRQLLKKQFDGGLIDADLFNKLAKEEFYVPFMRDLSDKPQVSGGTRGSSDGPGMTDTVKRMKGSSRDIKDPIESLMTQAFLVNRTLAHNDIIKAFVRLSEQAGIEGGRLVEKIPAHEGRGYNFDLAQSIERLAKERGVSPDDAKVLTSALTDVFGEDPIVGSFFRMEPAGKRGEPIVFYKEGGQMRAARFMSGEEGHALYETITALPTPLRDVWSQVVAATTSTLRAGITTNPMFALTNYIRDQFAVAILRNDYIPLVSGIRGISSEFKQGQPAVLYGYAGGVSGGASIAPLERAIESDVNALAKKGYLVNRLTSFKGAMDLAGVTEAGTRNSVFGKVFEAKKSQGLNDYEAMIEAAFSAQDILDFSRHGSGTEMIRKYIPFINAYMQGMDKAKRTMFDPIVEKVRGDQVFASDPKNFNNALLSVSKVLGVGGVLGAGWAALNAEKEGYRDVSPQIKGTHVVIPVGNRILLVPKPFELGIGFTAGEYAFQSLVQNDPRAGKQFAEAAWDSLTSGNPLTDIPLVKQYFELKSGKSLFTGKDIVPTDLQRLAPEMQYTNNTSSMAKWLGEKIGVAPIKVDYAIGSTFGLWGKDIMALSSGVDPEAPAQAWEDRVFIRRLLKDPSRTSDVTTKFWEYMGRTTGKYNQAVNTFDKFIERFCDDDAKDFASKLPEGQRVFVMLKSGANEDGKPAFKLEERRLHPLQRAYDAVTILNGLRRELTDNTFKTYESGERTKLSPESRRDLIDNVRELAQMEMRNSFVIMKEPGYQGRALLDVKGTMDKIMAADPQVGVEIATRYATKKIYKTDQIAKAYPELSRALLRDGSDADIGNLAADVAAEGPEFDGDRVKKPQKRRVQMKVSP